MKTRLKQLLVVATAATGIVAGMLTGASSASAESNGGVRIMPLGDSITDGITVSGAYRTALWQHFVSAGAKVDFVGSLYGGPSTLGDHDHEGHSGWRIDQIDSNVVTWLRNTTPRTVLLHIGTNDILQNYNVSTAPQRLSTLIDHILTTVPDVHLFVATIIPIANSSQDAAARTYNAQLPAIVQAKVSTGKHVVLVDMHSALTTSDLADGVHPTATGYAKMADAWWSALQRDPASYQDVVTTTTTRTTTTTTRPTTTTSRTTTTTSTAPVTTTRTTTVTGGRSCTAAYAVQSSWSGGFVANVTVTAGSAAISSWQVALTLPSGASIASTWNGVASGTTGAVTVANAAYNGSLGAGQATSFGFQGTGSGSGATVSCSAG